MIYWGIEVSQTFPNDVVYIPTQCSIEDKDTGDTLKLTENGCPISDIETLLGQLLELTPTLSELKILNEKTLIIEIRLQ